MWKIFKKSVTIKNDNWVVWDDQYGHLPMMKAWDKECTTNLAGGGITCSSALPIPTPSGVGRRTMLAAKQRFGGAES